MNLAYLLQRAAKTWGTRPALSVGREVRLTYAQMGARVPRLAAGLIAAGGLQRGDRVALVLKNSPEYWELMFALWHAGLAAVPVNAKLHAREVAWIVENSGAKLVVASAALADDLAALLGGLPAPPRLIVAESTDFTRLYDAAPLPMAGDIDENALAWLFYTSGTTGRPKGAMLTHRNLWAATLNYFADVDRVGPQDCIIHCAPISHGSGLYGLPHVARGANQVIPYSGGFDPAETLDLIAHWPGCSFFFAPTMVHRLVHAPQIATADTSNLKTIVYGGGPMYVADLLDAMRVLGPKLAQIYGQGEAPMTITGMDKGMHVDDGHPRYRERIGSAGVARTDVEVRVVDAADNPLPPGEIGEIVCRGPVVMAGYWNNPEATAQALLGGWLHTGDVGSFDEDGWLTLKDRSKDMIISGGSNIYPREIEEVLLQHPDIAEVSVVGKPHPDWGEEVVAFVVGRDGAAVTAATLDALCLDHIARFKRPKQYRFLPALPKNNYGKVLKTDLRRLLQEEP
ncbi:acyl-CoA synthetase [Ferrovibrio xuzhouensis]|uniref:Long-chain fatty acid--CoA ligase n=1 Tax=Ferrovibrio xuzhouensis TaxID=1576914 RepID=A0ABV7VB94_9PROT